MKNQALNTNIFNPLYKQLMQKIRDDIAAGVYPVNSRIPSEQELCDTYKVSRVTVRKALFDLTQEGLLKRRQGKGTFVSVPRIQRDLKEVTSFHAACRMIGCKPSTRVIHSVAKGAQPQDVERLHLDPDEDTQIVEVLRVRLADGEPVMLENNHFPMKYDFLLMEDMNSSLYQLLAEHGLEPKQAVHDISLCYASPFQAKHLNLEPGSALLQLNEVIYDANGAPLHTSHQLIRGDRFTFRI